MKYLLINSLACGGAERQATLLATYISFQKVFLLEKDQYYSSTKTTVVPLSSHAQTTPMILKLFSFLVYAWRLKKQIAERNSLVVSFLERANFVNIIAKLFFRHTAIISVFLYPSYFYAKGLRRFQRFLVRILYPFADAIVVNSQAIKEDLTKHFGLRRTKIHVIYNMIEVNVVKQAAKENLDEPIASIFQNPVIITVGRLTYDKAQWHLIRIYSELKKTFQNLKLVLIGDGELRQQLFTLRRASGCSENDIHFLGTQRNPFRFVARATIFALTSLGEGFPNALCEAIVCGVPVVVSDCLSGPREILAPDSPYTHVALQPQFTDYGVLMPIFDGKFLNAKTPLITVEQMWVDVLTRLLRDEVLREKLSKNAKSRVEDLQPRQILHLWNILLDSFKHETIRRASVLKTKAPTNDLHDYNGRIDVH